MSYVQGTKITVLLEFTDPNTNGPADPDDVMVWIFPPATAPDPTVIELAYSLSQVEKIADSTGRFSFVLDTSAASGDWRYEVEGTGADAVVKNRTIRVNPRLATP